jgi:hypothetical protein
MLLANAVGFLVCAAVGLPGVFAGVAPFFWNGEDTPPVWLRIGAGAFGAFFMWRATVALRQFVRVYRSRES